MRDILSQLCEQSIYALDYLQYTGKVSYVSSNKNDNTYLGRFTFDTILKFEGLSRVLTIIARGFLYHDRDGALLPYPDDRRIAYTERALLAWCSMSVFLLKYH